MGKLKVIARIFGPRLQARMRKFPAEAQRLLDDALLDVADFSEEAFDRHAPEQTGRLKRGIVITPTSSGLTIRAKAIDPETGFDYVGVTRFGHKVRRIYPVHQPRSRTGRRTRRQGMLRFSIGGRVLYRSSVRGVRRTNDWVVPARGETRAYSRGRMNELGREIARRWGG